MNATPSQPFHKKRPFLLACVAAAIVLAAAIYYRSSEIPLREQALEQRSAEGQRLLNNITNATLLQEHYEELVGINKKVAEKLINPAQLGENLQFFYRIEAATNTKIVDLRQTYTAPKGAKPRFVAVPYMLTIRGAYHPLMNFVRRIEKSARMTRVASASLTMPFNEANISANPEMTLTVSVELLGTP